MLGARKFHARSNNKASESLPDLGLTVLPPTPEVLWQTPSTQPPMAAFQQWADAYRAAPSPEMLAEGVRLATERRAVLSGLIRRDPAAALAVAVPEAVRRAMPPAVHGLLENDKRTEK